ncbi:DUF3429 domain-containing protein [Qipengyuania sp. XHP0207]|uniref:DUF3429 domain-containing protein n=1 Tax=Qipengyuania sp. XHP0207 TaxID=3038078 RepID=UPI00241C6026|nr:DUF3429 domain-containing protein [Qipengyuania sp. XHP0207]MDG5746712.1 DUF3429 domain-containing protein [Qipengyuania sp. XHP0207]
MRDVPSLPRLLGLAGLLPQLACVIALYAGPDEWRYTAQAIAFGYAALIFSFLGGMWWGIAAMAPAAENRKTLGWVWVAAVAPSLIALFAYLPWVFGQTWPEPSLIMLGAGILMSLAVDAKLRALAPNWWMSLRVPLSLGLGLATVAAALA